MSMVNAGGGVGWGVVMENVPQGRRRRRRRRRRWGGVP